MALSFDSITSLLLVDVSLGPKTIQLPFASERPGRVLTIKDSGFCNTDKSITIVCAGSGFSADKFETGGSTYTLVFTNSYITIVSDPSFPGWRIIARSEVALPDFTDMYIKNLSTARANLSTISTNNIDVNNISAITVSIERAYLRYANIEHLSVNVLFANIVSTAITHDITGVTVDNAYISSATISSLVAYSTFTSQLYVTDIHAADISCAVINQGFSTMSTAIANLSNVSLSAFSSLSTAISELDYSTTVRYNSTVLGFQSLTGLATRSTVQGLATIGYVSTTTLSAYINSLGSDGYVSTTGMNTTIASTITGLGSLAYISTLSLQSSINGLGTLAYTSTASLLSTSAGLGTIGYISTLSLQSSINGLGLFYISTASLLSTTTGLGRLGYISTQSLQSSMNNLGTIGYISTTSLTSTGQGLGSLGYISTIQSTARTAAFQKISFNIPLYYTNTPTTVNGLNLWFDSTDPLNTGAAPTLGLTIPTWYDRSAAMNHATSGSCTVENDGYNYINFNSNSYLIPGNFFNNNYFTVFIVESVQVLNSTTPTYIYNDTYILGVTNSGPANNSLHIAYRQGGGINGFLLGFFSDDLATSLNPITTNVTRLWSVTFGQAPVPFTQSIYLFGTSQGTRTASAYMSGGSGFRIGGAFGLQTYRGRMREILAYQGSMGTYDRQRVEGYLAWKWGIKGNLPVNHPYYSVPPVKNFYPTSISGLRIWLDGKDPLTTGTAPSNGTTLGIWYDKSGYGYNATGTGNPTYNATGITLNGSSQYYSLPYSGSHTTETGFIIFNPQNVGPTTDMNLLCPFNRGGGRQIAISSGKTYFFSYYVIYINDQPLPTSGVLNMVEYTISPSSSAMFTNGIMNSSVSNGLTLGSETGVRIGTSGFADGSFFNGSMCEVMIFNTVLSTTDRQKIEGYLAWKWGITLSGGHPYASAAPTI